MARCLNNSAVAGCYNDGVNPPVPVVIHYVYDNKGAPAVRVTDTAGVLIAAADETNTVPGPCVAGPVSRSVSAQRVTVPDPGQPFDFAPDTVYSVSVTFFEAGEVLGQPVPAGFTWSVSGVGEGKISNAVSGSGTDYIVTSVGD